MARRREFDEHQVVDKAIEVFTRHGLVGTDTTDLCEQAGISRSSFYNTFHSKDAMFERALSEYTKSGRAEMERMLAPGVSAPVALRTRMASQIGKQCASDERAGCLSVNTAVELGRSIGEVAQLLDADRVKWVESYGRLVARGQAQGQFRRDLVPETHGMIVHTMLAGLRVAARIADPPEVMGQIDAFVSSLCTPAGRRTLVVATDSGPNTTVPEES